MTDTAVPSNEDILRFCTALLAARDDLDLVKQVIAEELADQPEWLHTTYLTVVLRTVISQFFAGAADTIDSLLGPAYIEAALARQGAANEGVDLNQ